MNIFRKRFMLLSMTVIALFLTSWLELFVQKRQPVIGGGINRILFFLLINAHVIVLLILFYLIIRQSIKLFAERRKEKPGSVFRRNLLFAFTIFSVLPTFFVFIVAGRLITTSIDSWFDQRIGNGLQHARKLHEQHTSTVKAELEQLLTPIVATINTEHTTPAQLAAASAPHLDALRKQGLDAYLWEADGAAVIGSLGDEVSVWRSYRRVNDRTTAHLRSQFFAKIEAAQTDRLVTDFYGSAYAIEKLWPAGSSRPLLLVVAKRYPEAIRYPLIELETSIDDYKRLKGLSSPIFWHYFLLFVLATLLIIMLSIWAAFYLAQGISQPIQQLLAALQKIRKGDWNTRVRLNPSSDLNSLAIGINEMTDSLRRARLNLEQNYTEMLAIFEHIKASVFVVNRFGRIITYNRASKELINSFLGLSRFKNKKVSFFGDSLTTTFTQLVRKLIASDSHQLSHELTYTHEGQTKTVIVHLTFIQTSVKKPHNMLLIVVEDLTTIVKINKIKTWQQAARQMAHEIKNPLTPIQLATQRLRRKYRKGGQEDEVFGECTQTILDQVTIIRNLVSHFADFGTMPEAMLQPADINRVVNDVLSLYQVSYPNIVFARELQNFLPLLHTDVKKIKRVLVNLLDNSIRALNQSQQPLDEKKITLSTRFSTRRNQIELIVADTGPGIPKDVTETLFLPHVSTSKKNMGLGLAIVHESIKQMGGSIKLLRDSRGARFQIRLPV